MDFKVIADRYGPLSAYRAVTAPFRDFRPTALCTRTVFFCIAVVLGVFVISVPAPVSIAQSTGNQATITRLDGSTITAAEIDATVTRLMKEAEVTGAGIALFDRGKVAYLKAYGFRDKEKNLPLTVDSVMSAASISKSAFAYLVMELVDAGVIDLDKPVYQYLPKPLPEYPKYADLAGDERYKRITARMLLDHTSGFANWRWLEEDRKLHIHFEPGSRFAYSGEGIDLLQLVVETVTKQSLEDLMQQHIFQPFGMTRTSMIWQERFESDYANGYDEYGRSVGAHRWKNPDAAGSMSITPSDLSKFMLAVMEGRGLRPKTREEMLSPQIQITAKHEFPSLMYQPTDENKSIRLSYGVGWGLYWTPYGEVFFKEGHDDGWRDYVVCFDKQKSGMIIMTNSGNGEGIYEYLLEKLLKDTYTPIEWEQFTPYDKLPPRPQLKQHKEVAIDPKLLDRYVGRYTVPPNVILTVRREGNHLSVQENDEPRQDLLPESETDFFSTAADDVYTFQVDGQSHVTAMTLHTGGEDIVIKRMND
jgi:CubicO group peptidase (beta-lactamase class C family)